MRAATIRDGRIEVVEHPDPEPQDGQLLVRVRAAGLNGADMLQLAGGYPAPPGAPPDIPGLELAGEVVAVGRRAGRFEVGDRVMSLVSGGGQAELESVDVSRAAARRREHALSRGEQAAGTSESGRVFVSWCTFSTSASRSSIASCTIDCAAARCGAKKRTCCAASLA